MAVAKIAKAAREAATWDRIMAALDAYLAEQDPPSVTRVAEADARPDPFRVLVATVISLRTQDAVTEAAAERLFRFAATPQALADAPLEAVEAAIRPANFYPTKARKLQAIARRLLDEFDGRVPADLDTLLTFDGVGRKTANLVLTEGFDLPGVCVDTHVHRIPNRMGLLATRDPGETEAALREVLPPRYWKPINTRLVRFGQLVCKPVSPLCSSCPLAAMCLRVGVHR